LKGLAGASMAELIGHRADIAGRFAYLPLPLHQGTFE